MSETHNNEPFVWPVDWNNLTENQRFFQEVPLFGIKAFVKRCLDRKMKCRTKDILHLWPDDQMVKSVRDFIIFLLVNYSFWKQPLFHPQDPCDIIFWKPNENLEGAEILLELSRRFTLPTLFFENFHQKTLLQLVESICYFKHNHQISHSK